VFLKAGETISACHLGRRFPAERTLLVPIELCLKAPLHICHPDDALGIFKHQAAGHRRNAVAPRRGNRSLERVLGMNRRQSGLPGPKPGAKNDKTHTNPDETLVMNAP
jgi:hypothetical protein